VVPGRSNNSKGIKTSFKKPLNSESWQIEWAQKKYETKLLSAIIIAFHTINRALLGPVFFISNYF